MKNLTPEMIEKAKAAKTAEELLELAKANGVEMTADEAKTYFAQLNPKSGELDDDDLDNVAGGCGDPETPGEPKFNVGDQVYYLVTKPVGPRAFPVQEKVFSTVTRVDKGADGGYVYTLSNGKIIGENSLYR